jgi:hypothetical protein
MKVQRYGEYRPKQKDNLNTLKFIERSLNRLDHLLGVIFRHNPEKQQQFISNLILRIKPLINTTYAKNKSINILRILNKTENLRNYPELAELMFNLGIEFLNLSRNIPWEKEEINILDKDIARGYSFPLYYQVSSLVEIIGRKEAFDLYQRHHELYRESHQNIQKFEDLDTVREFFIKGAQNWGNILMISDVTNGKLIIRRDHCIYSEVLRELNDPELTNLIMCSGDFSYWKATNSDFVLTRRHTLMEGHSYCDFVFHDTRINNELIHPLDIFFDNL